MIHLQGGEYIYLDNVHLEGSNRETEQVGLEVVSSAELYIDDCDFCNFKNGKAIYYYTSGYPFLVSSMCRVIDMAVRGISPYSEPILSQLVFSFLKNKKTGMRTVNCAGKTIVETVV